MNNDITDLTHDEYWLIRVYFAQRGFGLSHYLIDIEIAMLHYRCDNVSELIRSLISKNVLNLSPDGRRVKFTDYGVELYQSMKHAQAEWDNQPLIRVSRIEKDEILIRAGEAFRANRIVRELLSSATHDLCIIDPYVGSSLFDLLEDSGHTASVRISTSTRLSQTAKDAYMAYRVNSPQVEMRTISGDIHDRFVLWDGARGFHIGHSLKDLGTKDTQLNLIVNPKQQLKLFEGRWRQATTIT